MLVVERILGSRLDPALAGRLHDLEHHGRVDRLTLSADDLARQRLRTISAQGEDVSIALPQSQTLYDGAVLLLEQDRALVVQLSAQHWLRLQPRSIADAVELGFQAGNLHWRVRFQGEALLVALEAPTDSYLDRIGPLLAGRRVTSSVISEE